MKLNEILSEEAMAGVTSVSSIGSVEYRAWPSMVKLYKRNDQNVPCCVAKIKRHKGQGWRIITTDEWKKMNLPHFGYIHDLKTPVSGQKTISNNLSNMLKAWGIKHGEIKCYRD
jgi:hypothetical protein